VNGYVILLRRMERHAGQTLNAPIEPRDVIGLAESMDVQILDIISCIGIFDAALLCHAPDNRHIARLLDSLEDWHTDAMLATSHTRYEARHPIGPSRFNQEKRAKAGRSG